jgi:hypothetical protein
LVARGEKALEELLKKFESKESTKAKKPQSTEAEKAEKPHKCHDCSFAADTSSNLNIHRRSKHTKGDFLYKPCKKRFETKFQVDIHQQNNCKKMSGPKCDTQNVTLIDKRL